MRHEKGGKGRGGPPEHSATADTSPSGGGGTGQRPGVRGAETAWSVSGRPGDVALSSRHGWQEAREGLETRRGGFRLAPRTRHRCANEDRHGSFLTNAAARRTPSRELPCRRGWSYSLRAGNMPWLPPAPARLCRLARLRGE